MTIIPDQEDVKVSPFSLRGTINESGLGLLSWWNS